MGHNSMRIPKRLCNLLSDGSFFSNQNFSVVLTVSYLASFIWILFIPADFWDDLNFKNNPDRIKLGIQAGSPLLGYLWTVQLALPWRELLTHLAVVCGFLGISLLLRHVILLFHVEDDRTRNAIALLTATLPVFQSRFLQAILINTLALLLFLVGVILVVQSLRQGSILKRILAYSIFIPAFSVPSLLVLYEFFLLVLVIARADLPTARPYSTADRFQAVVIFVRRAPDVVAFPFIYYLVKGFLFPISGPFAEVSYHSFGLTKFFDTAARLPFKTFEALIAIPADGAPWALMLFVAACQLCLLLFLAIRGRAAETLTAPKKTWSDGCALSVAMIGAMMAVFPYALVNRTVGMTNFDDRNQLTLLLTLGALVVFAVKYLVRKHLQWIVLQFFLIWGVAQNIATYISIIADGHTQNAVVTEFSRNDALRKGTAFVVDTSDWPALSRGRQLSTGQLNCLLKDAFGDERRFAAHLSERPLNWKREMDFLMIFRDTGTCFRDFTGGDPLLVKVMPSTTSIRTGLWLSVLRYVNPQQYQARLVNVVRISVSPASPDVVI